jgi:hypothetical protein
MEAVFLLKVGAQSLEAFKVAIDKLLEIKAPGKDEGANP